MRALLSMVRSIKRYILKLRIDWLGADIAMADERASTMAEGAERLKTWIEEHRRKLRIMRIRLSLLERPETLLPEAMQNRSIR